VVENQLLRKTLWEIDSGGGRADGKLDAAVRTGAPAIEIHTGHYADATDDKMRDEELHRIMEAVTYGTDAGLQVNAGHGLNYHNVEPVAAIHLVRELNIGHAIVARALFVGMQEAVRQMKGLMTGARK